MPLDVLWFTTLLLRIGLSIVAFYIALLFFIKVKRAKETGFDLSAFMGLAIFAFFVGIMEIIYTYFYYYVFQFNLDIFGLYLAAMTFGSIGITGLAFLSEKMFRKTKYALTIFSISFIVLTIFFLRTIEDIQFFSTVIQCSVVLFLIVIFIHSLILKTKGEIRRKMEWSLLGFIGIFFFYMLDTEVGQSLVPLPNEITIIISLVGLIIVTIFWGLIFLSFETFTEFGWKDQLKELFIIAPNGGTLFHYSFKKETDSHEPDLITSGLTGIKDILAEMVQSQEKLKTVDHQDVKILFEYGTYSTLALIAYENLRIYHSKLAQLINQFEKFFHEFLIHWSGEIEVFRPSKELIEEIFG